MNAFVPHVSSVRTGVAAALLLLSGAACKSPIDPGFVGIRIVSGAGAADTVTAVLSQPLVVEFYDPKGQLQPGVELTFEAKPALIGGESHPSVHLAPPSGDQFTAATKVVTDAQGRAEVRVALGRVAGPGTVTITAPEASATAEYTIRPGMPISLSVAPADTAVFVGASYSLRIAAPDRFGNPSAPAYLPGSGSVSASAGTINGVAAGRTWVTIQAGNRSATIHVSVVPQGTLLAAGPGGVYTFALDGSALRRVVAHAGARSPRWFPGGQTFVYSVGLSHAFVSDMNGATRRLDPSSPLTAELWAHPSRDGEWVYFGGYSGFDFRGYPHRVRPDGSDLQLVPGFTADDVTQGQPTPSPDGARIAYFREEGSSRNVFIRVLNMSTGAVTAGVPGHSPAWSHGDSIAYLHVDGSDRGPIKVMAPDGTGQRLVADAPYAFGIDWSPDDRWIVGRNVATDRIEVVHVSTGIRIPLPYSGGLSDPSWKP